MRFVRGSDSLPEAKLSFVLHANVNYVVCTVMLKKIIYPL